MIDAKMLESYIQKSGLKKSFIAGELGLDRSSFYKKANNQIEFTASEVVKLKDVLNLSRSERDAIFFSKRFTDSKLTDDKGNL